MIYTLPMQSEEMLEKKYFDLRAIIDPVTDKINLVVSSHILNTISKEEIYKRILKIDGVYRSSMNAWVAPAVKLRVIAEK